MCNLTPDDDTVTTLYYKIRVVIREQTRVQTILLNLLYFVSACKILVSSVRAMNIHHIIYYNIIVYDFGLQAVARVTVGQCTFNALSDQIRKDWWYLTRYN